MIIKSITGNKPKLFQLKVTYKYSNAMHRYFGLAFKWEFFLVTNAVNIRVFYIRRICSLCSPIWNAERFSTITRWRPHIWCPKALQKWTNLMEMHKNLSWSDVSWTLPRQCRNKEDKWPFHGSHRKSASMSTTVDNILFPHNQYWPQQF